MSPCVRSSHWFVIISLFLNFCSLKVIITVVVTRLKKVIGLTPQYLKRCHCPPFTTLINTNLLSGIYAVDIFCQDILCFGSNSFHLILDSLGVSLAYILSGRKRIALEVEESLLLLLNIHLISQLIWNLTYLWLLKHSVLFWINLVGKNMERFIIQD